MARSPGLSALVAVIALIAIGSVVFLTMKQLFPGEGPPLRFWRGGGWCPISRRCHAKGDGQLCCAGAQKCFQGVCCLPEYYKNGSCCPDGQRKAQGGCCPAGQRAQGNDCVLPCGRHNHCDPATKTCVEVEYQTPEQGAHLRESMGEQVTVLDEDEGLALSCQPKPVACATRGAVFDLPAKVHNSQLAFPLGSAKWTKGDVYLYPEDPNDRGLLQQYADGASLDDIRELFVQAEDAYTGPLDVYRGHWCNPAPSSFYIRAVRGMDKACGWKHCMERLQTDGLQNVHYEPRTGRCAGLYAQRPGIALRAKDAAAADDTCLFRTQACYSEEQAREFCQTCMGYTDVGGAGASKVRCREGGKVENADMTKVFWQCLGNQDCTPCSISGRGGVDACDPQRKHHLNKADCETKHWSCPKPEPTHEPNPDVVNWANSHR